MKHGSGSGIVVAALAGVVVGVLGCICTLHFAPAVRMKPALYTKSELRFGTDELGRPALCDQAGNALAIDNADHAGQRLVLSSENRNGVIVALQCRSAEVSVSFTSE